MRKVRKLKWKQGQTLWSGLVKLCQVEQMFRVCYTQAFYAEQQLYYILLFWLNLTSDCWGISLWYIKKINERKISKQEQTARTSNTPPPKPSPSSPISILWMKITGGERKWEKELGWGDRSVAERDERFWWREETEAGGLEAEKKGRWEGWRWWVLADELWDKYWWDL